MLAYYADSLVVKESMCETIYLIRWANGTFAGEGTKRRRMALIDENTESEDVMEPVVAVDPVEDNARWAAERFELQSQIEDLQALNFSMRGIFCCQST